MGKFITVRASEIVPSQDFLKENTVRYIMKCIAKGQLDELPPTPLVREHPMGSGYIAIDGHNLIAVKDHLNQAIEVYVADNAEDGLQDTNLPGVDERNADLKQKFNAVVLDAETAAAVGINSFPQLEAKYPNLFEK